MAKPKYQLICMAFDGDYQRERPEFETIEEAWAYDIGSKQKQIDMQMLRLCECEPRDYLSLKTEIMDMLNQRDRIENMRLIRKEVSI